MGKIGKMAALRVMGTRWCDYLNPWRTGLPGLILACLRASRQFDNILINKEYNMAISMPIVMIYHHLLVNMNQRCP